jgi:hypothetical protein
LRDGLLAWRRDEEDADLLLQRAESIMRGAFLYAEKGQQPQWREHVLDEERWWSEMLGFKRKPVLCTFEACPLARRKTFSEDFMRRLADTEKNC